MCTPLAQMAIKCMPEGQDKWVWACDFHGFSVKGDWVGLMGCAELMAYKARCAAWFINRSSGPEVQLH